MATADWVQHVSWGRLTSAHLAVSAGWSTIDASEEIWMGTYNWSPDDATVIYQFHVCGCANSFMSGGTPTFPSYQCRLYDATNAQVIAGPVTISRPGFEQGFAGFAGPLATLPAGNARLRLEYTGGGTDGGLNGAEFFAASLWVRRA